MNRRAKIRRAARRKRHMLVTRRRNKLHGVRNYQQLKAKLQEDDV